MMREGVREVKRSSARVGQTAAGFNGLISRELEGGGLAVVGALSLHRVAIVVLQLADLAGVGYPVPVMLLAVVPLAGAAIGIAEAARIRAG